MADQSDSSESDYVPSEQEDEGEQEEEVRRCSSCRCGYRWTIGPEMHMHSYVFVVVAVVLGLMHLVI